MDSDAAGSVRWRSGRAAASGPCGQAIILAGTQHSASPVNQPSTQPEQDVRAGALEALTALFALGREVTSVLDLEELLQKIPELISRITKFKAFAVYLLDPKRSELTIAYSVGYPPDVARTLRMKVGEGLVGAAVADGL